MGQQQPILKRPVPVVVEVELVAQPIITQITQSLQQVMEQLSLVVVEQLQPSAILNFNTILNKYRVVDEEVLAEAVLVAVYWVQTPVILLWYGRLVVMV